MNRQNYLNWIRRWLWLWILAALVSGAVAFLVSKRTPPTYTATATLLVNATAQPNLLTLGDVQLSQSLTLTYSKLITETPVVQQGRLPMSVIQLQHDISANPIAQTQLFTVTASGPTPQEAAHIANLTAQVFTQQQNQRIKLGQDSNAISVVEPASPPQFPSSPHVLLNTLIGVAVGFLIAFGIVALITYFDDSIATEEDLELLDLSLLGVVRRDPTHAAVKIEDGKIQSDNRFSEIFRVVRANVEFAIAPSQARVLMVTSAEKAEGKTTIATRLALAFAEANKQTILVDADLRLPQVHREFGLENRFGLTSILVNVSSRDTTLENYIHATPQPNLWVMTSGAVPPNPAELLHSDAMSILIDTLRERFEIVIIDTPPVLAVADAMTLASKAGGIVFVLENGRARFTTTREALTRLRRSNTPLLGAVMNKVARDSGSYYYYYSYDGYYDNTEAAARGKKRVSSRAT
ncbi:MAG: polysaccharide biosynthesis tyrosine autokinase [Chloroflexi bacterium]|nr:polysaccharide biosynthesis tyrosine autokinase [Chloroflexota bacterium]